MVTQKQLHCAQIPNMMIYSNNMTTWKRTSNICNDTIEWLHSSMVRNYIFFQNITINNYDSEKTPLCMDKNNEGLYQ